MDKQDNPKDPLQPLEQEDPQERELRAAIYSNPDDEETWAVYSDWLQSNNDPRGELMALEAALLGDNNNKSIKKQKDALMAKHQDIWLSKILKKACSLPQKKPVMTMDWRHGFIHRACIEGPRTISTPTVQGILVDLFRSPSSNFISEIKFSPIMSDEAPFNNFIKLMVNRDLSSQSLRVLRLVNGYEFQHKMKVDGVHQLLSLLPALEHLELSGACVFSENPAHKQLKHLDIRLQHPLDESMEFLSRSDFPNLETLKLTLDYSELDRDPQLAPFRSLVSNDSFPKLKQLSISELGDNSKTLESLLPSPLINRIETLRLNARHKEYIWPELLKLKHEHVTNLEAIELRVSRYHEGIRNLRKNLRKRLKIITK